jgi:hypothetical protein
MKTRPIALALSALLVAACGADYNAVALTDVCFPPEPGTGGVCQYSATCDATLASTASLDVVVATEAFQLPIEITNQLLASNSSADGRVNVNDAFVQQIEMEYVGAPLAASTIPVQVTVPAAGNSVEVLQLIQASDYATLQSLIPTSASKLQLVVKVRASGILGSQQKFTTAWFQIPVDVFANVYPANPCPTGTLFTGACPAWGQTSVIKCE